MSRNRQQCAVLFAIAALAMGCGAPNVAAPKSTGAQVSNAAPSKPSDEECIAFAKQLEGYVAAGDVDSATAAIDWAGLFDEAIEGFPPESDFIAGIRSVLVDKPTAVYSTICADIKNTGSYKFLRIKSSSEGKRALFRYHSIRGLNYHEILLKRGSNGIIGRDIFLYTIGERHSQLIRRTVVLELSGRQEGKGLPLSNAELDYAKHVADWSELTEAVNTGRYTDALSAYDRLPPSLQRERRFLLSRLEAAEQVGKEETLAAVKAFDAAYPDDAAADLHRIQTLTLQEDFAGARKAIDQLEKLIEGDPYLDVLRAKFLVKEGNLSDADVLAKEAIASDSKLKEAWWIRVTVAVKQREFSRTVELLKAIEIEIGQEPANIESPFYADFLKSSEYLKWKEEAKP